MGFPENTLITLREACKFGVDWVEFDVKVLLDGEMVSMHDNTVDRTTNGTGDITTMTYDEVSRLDASKGFTLGFVPVPRVEEILEVLASSPNYVQGRNACP